MNNMIGKILYKRQDDSCPFLYLTNYNPISKKSNTKKIISSIKSDEEEKNPIISLGKITSIKYFIKYTFSKDQSIDYNGNIRADQIYILISTDKNYNYYARNLSKDQSKIQFEGSTYTNDEIRSGWCAFKLSMPKTYIDKCDLRTSCYMSNQSYEGYFIEAHTTIPFEDLTYESRWNNIMTDIDLWRDKKIFVEYEQYALNLIEKAIKDKFKELFVLQRDFLAKIQAVDKYSTTLYI